MINLRAVYIGDGNESFVENGFANGINIISSDDNNVGKTIVMQSIMYAMGAMPSFPKSFHYSDYIYIVDLEVDGRPVTIMRSRNTFAVQDGETVLSLENAQALQRYWSENITELPTIVKDGRSVPVGLELYAQMAFVPQDKRSSSRVNAGRFNKNDFCEMLFAMRGLAARTLTSREINELKRRKAELKEQRKSLMKEASALRGRSTALSVISPTADREEMGVIISRLNEAKDEVAEFRKQRNRLLRRLTKNEIVLKELNSLKIDVKAGEIVCLDCGSTHIGYRMADSGFTFDITTPEMRSQILASVQQRIEALRAELEQVESELRSAQNRLEMLLSDKPVTLADVVACQDDYADEHELDMKITEIDDEIARIDRSLDTNEQVATELREQRKEFMDGIISTMNNVHRQISVMDDPDHYESLFTTDASVYSGSETTEYFISRTYALARHMGHGLPVLIDSFRAEDLSTMREERVLELMAGLRNQIILTTTIKQEEGPGKYGDNPSLHNIDYSNHQTNKLLSSEWNDVFASKVQEFGVILN